MRRVSSVYAYIALLASVGLPVTAYAVVTDVLHAGRVPWVAVVLLTIGLIIGEARPVKILGRVGGNEGSLTFSGGFGCALVLVAPLGIALIAQGITLVLDEVRKGWKPRRFIFNLSQYAITMVATMGAYRAITGTPLLDLNMTLSVRQLLGVLGAAVVFFLVNHALVSGVVALSTRQPFMSLFIQDDLRLQMLPLGMDLSLTPLAVAAIHYSPWLTPLLLLAPLVMHDSAKLAAMREHDATHDVLTGLPNRSLLKSAFSVRLQEVDAGTAELVVLLIDLDHFKEINDTLGHGVGDELLTEVAGRLSSVVRQDDVVARLGGDEFAVLSLLSSGEGRNEALGLAQRMVSVLEEPFITAGVRIDVQGSIGIAIAPEHGDTMEILMSRADIALYAAKEERGRAAFYDPEQDEHTVERLSLLGELRESVERQELVLHYQPKIDLNSDRVIGVEALIRWQHPERGLLWPDRFIPMAENTGVIVPLTLWILETSLAQARRWMDQGWELGMSVNLSVRHLTDLHLPDQVRSILDRHGVPAEMLTLEVTESTIMNDPSRAAGVLAGMRKLGVHIAIDDYGTGYSSLSYLRRLDVDELKIDKSFIADLVGENHDEVIVRSTIEMGHNLGLRVVAEGVEDAATWERLQQLSCDVIQGYALSHPLPAAELEAWLLRRQSPALARSQENVHPNA